MRKRVVTAGRQVLAKDVNDISDFLISDMNDLCKDVFAISAGIVNGFLNSGNSLLVATITAGKVHDNSTGTFFELIANTNVNLTASATNYIYAVQDSAVTTDLPVTGFKLIDTLTRAETYDTVNTRSYDSVSLVVNTTGIAPVDSHPLWELVTDATSVTSITDVRTFCTSGNLTAYSLQHFAQTGLNTVTIGSGVSQRMTLELYKSSVADYIGLDIAMVSGFAGKGFNFNLSSNVGSIGGVITTNNNLGLNIVNTGNTSKGIKIESSSILTTTTGLEIEKQKYGLSLINNDINIRAILSANQYGIDISEVSSGTTGVVGLNITDVASSINVTNSNTRTSGNLINITATSSSLNGSNFLNTLNGTGLAQAIVMNGGISDTSYGTLYKSTSVSGANVTAIAIRDSAVNITRGIAIEDCVTGIYINEVDASININNTNSSRTGTLIDVTGTGSVSSPSLINLTQNGKGYAQTTILASGLLANVAYGNYITNTGVANSAVGIDIDGSTTGYNAFHTGVLMSGVTRGIDISIVTGSSQYGAKITGNGIGVADGYVATSVNTGVDLTDFTTGFQAFNSAITSGTTGMLLGGVEFGINISESTTGLEITDASIGATTTGIAINNKKSGTIIQNSSIVAGSIANNVANFERAYKASSVLFGVDLINPSILSGTIGLNVEKFELGGTILDSTTGLSIIDASLSAVTIGLLIGEKFYGINASNTLTTTGTIGVTLSNYETGFNTNGCLVGLNSVSIGGTGSMGIYLEDYEKGIVIRDPDLTGIEIKNAGLFGVGVNNSILGFASDACDVGYSATGYTKAFMSADILTTAPSGNAIGDMFLFDDGAGTYSIGLYTSAGYKQIDFV